VENSFSESIEVEVVGLLKELKLPVFLSSEYRSGAATEATVVNSGYVKIMVREFFVDFLFCYVATGARFFGDLLWRRIAAVSRVFGSFHLFLFFLLGVLREGRHSNRKK
jgi:hypothetical protein